MNHDWPQDGQFSEYQKPKFGFTLSAAICPREPGFRCRPRMMRRTEPDTIYIPPPAAGYGALGRSVRHCRRLCRGSPRRFVSRQDRMSPIQITSSGDTLVGTPPVPIRSLRPAMTFAGTYAGSAFWYLDDEVIVFEGGDYGKSDDTFPVDCQQILRVGVYRGGSCVRGSQRKAPARGDLRSCATRRLAPVRARAEALADFVLAGDPLFQHAIAGVEHGLHRCFRQVVLNLAGRGTQQAARLVICGAVHLGSRRPNHRRRGRPSRQQPRG